MAVEGKIYLLAFLILLLYVFGFAANESLACRTRWAPLGLRTEWSWALGCRIERRGEWILEQEAEEWQFTTLRYARPAGR